MGRYDCAFVVKRDVDLSADLDRGGLSQQEEGSGCSERRPLRTETKVPLSSQCSPSSQRARGRHGEDGVYF